MVAERVFDPAVAKVQGDEDDDEDDEDGSGRDEHDRQEAGLVGRLLLELNLLHVGLDAGSWQLVRGAGIPRPFRASWIG